MGVLKSEGDQRPTRRDDQLTGVVTRLPSMSIKVYKITLDVNGNYVSGVLETTVVSDAMGVIPDITVAGAPGTLYRCRIDDDGQFRCGFWDIVAT
jgi:hypothetical protein